MKMDRQALPIHFLEGSTDWTDTPDQPDLTKLTRDIEDGYCGAPGRLISAPHQLQGWNQIDYFFFLSHPASSVIMMMPVRTNKPIKNIATSNM
jgi:hypothetical protein